MIVLVVVLAVVALGSLGALLWLLLRTPDWLGTRWPRVDPVAGAALDRAPSPPVAAGTTRRLISIEILNSRELAGTRGRLAGLAHTVVPGLTRRVVYDQVVKILREQLIAQQVDADVRVHVLRPGLAPDESSPLPGVAAAGSGDNSDGVAGQAPV